MISDDRAQDRNSVDDDLGALFPGQGKRPGNMKIQI
jgi:hypothetical protein